MEQLFSAASHGECVSAGPVWEIVGWFGDDCAVTERVSAGAAWWWCLSDGAVTVVVQCVSAVLVPVGEVGEMR